MLESFDDGISIKSTAPNSPRHCADSENKLLFVIDVIDCINSDAIVFEVFDTIFVYIYFLENVYIISVVLYN